MTENIIRDHLMTFISLYPEIKLIKTKCRLENAFSDLKLEFNFVFILLDSPKKFGF